MKHIIVVCMLSVVALACGGAAYHATPVTAAPATPDEQKAIQAALIGRWKWEKTVNASGKEITEDNVSHFAFDEAGKLRYQYASVDSTYDYHLDGKNLVTTHPGMPSLRVESVSPTEIRVFWYALSVTPILERE